MTVVEGERKIRSTKEIGRDRDPKLPKEAKEIDTLDLVLGLTSARTSAVVRDLREIVDADRDPSVSRESDIPGRRTKAKTT